ncbi:hypothetical protein [Winogradskyella forsetii]|uniref:hypothetical protein n=1 Tax=Winogradskyella forsetii TaxID=2686077 RepID=UPI0015BE63DA|nr:hypothetical protein [Winogradskyella forsetii]
MKSKRFEYTVCFYSIIAMALLILSQIPIIKTYTDMVTLTEAMVTVIIAVAFYQLIKKRIT